MKSIVALLFVLISAAAHAKPSQIVDVFAGERYVSRAVHAQASGDVVRAMKVPKRLRRTKTHRWPPLPRRAPIQALAGAVDPLAHAAPQTVWGGIQRETAQIVGGRPAGCPSRFCGCGAALHLFGRIIPALNLAANWLRFPRAAPAPNMVAARHGHVFVLKEHIAGNTWRVYDANSGGHRTRIHPRSIAGFTIVNPYGGTQS